MGFWTKGLDHLAPGDYTAQNGDHVRIERWHQPAGEGYWLAKIEYWPPLRVIHVQYDTRGVCLSATPGYGCSDVSPVIADYDLIRHR